MSNQFIIKTTTGEANFVMEEKFKAEEEGFENFSNYLWSFRTRMPFAARIYCDEQYFYWAARFAFGNKRGN